MSLLFIIIFLDRLSIRLYIFIKIPKSRRDLVLQLRKRNGHVTHSNFVKKGSVGIRDRICRPLLFDSLLETLSYFSSISAKCKPEVTEK